MDSIKQYRAHYSSRTSNTQLLGVTIYEFNYCRNRQEDIGELDLKFYVFIRRGERFKPENKRAITPIQHKGEWFDLIPETKTLIN